MAIASAATAVASWRSRNRAERGYLRRSPRLGLVDGGRPAAPRRAGRAGRALRRPFLAVALFQDLAVIPIVLLLPALASGDGALGTPGGLAASPSRSPGTVVLVAVARGFLVPSPRPLVARMGSRETFTAAVVVVVLAMIALGEKVGRLGRDGRLRRRDRPRGERRRRGRLRDARAAPRPSLEPLLRLGRDAPRPGVPRPRIRSSSSPARRSSSCEGADGLPGAPDGAGRAEDGR